MQNSCTPDPPAQPIHAELYGTEIAVAGGIKVEHRSPVCDLARALVDAGYHRDARLECYRRDEVNGGHKLCLTGRLGWFAAHYFTEGTRPLRAERHRPQSQSASESTAGAFHTGAPASQAPNHREETGAAVSGVSDHEQADNFRHILVCISDEWRVILCPAPPEFILQRRAGRIWQARSFCTTREVLIRECRGRVGPMSAEAESALEALPEHASHYKCENESGRARGEARPLRLSDSTRDKTREKYTTETGKQP